MLSGRCKSSKLSPASAFPNLENKDVRSPTPINDRFWPIAQLCGNSIEELTVRHTKLLACVDANPQIGISQVRRGLTLTQTWNALGGVSYFASMPLPAILKKRFARARLEAHFELPGARDSRLDRVLSELAFGLQPGLDCVTRRVAAATTSAADTQGTLSTACNRL